MQRKSASEDVAVRLPLSQTREHAATKATVELRAHRPNFQHQFSVGVNRKLFKGCSPQLVRRSGRASDYLARSFTAALAIGTKALVTSSLIGGALVMIPWSTKVLI